MAYEDNTRTPHTPPRDQTTVPRDHTRPDVHDNRVINRSSGPGMGVGIAAVVLLLLVLAFAFIDWGGDGGTTVIQEDPAATTVEPDAGSGTAPVTETAPAPADDTGVPATEGTAPPADGSTEQTPPAADQ